MSSSSSFSSSNDRNDRRQTLHPDDARIIDLLVDNQFDLAVIGKLSVDERRRAERVVRMFHLLDDYPVDDEIAVPEDDTLVHATLARIQREVDRAESGLRLESARGGGRRRLPLPDFISVAAVLLITAAILWPALGEMQRRSVDARCRSNLSSLGTAFHSYARDFAGRVPMATAGWSAPGALAEWVDTEALVKHGYCEHGHLNCPGHAGTSRIGYSRQLLVSGGTIRMLTAGELPIVGDRNPLLDVVPHSAEYLDPRMNSIDHGRRGQNVLRTDGSVPWLEMPIVGADDNIWLIHGQQTIRRDMVPDSENDIFLIHPVAR